MGHVLRSSRSLLFLMVVMITLIEKSLSFNVTTTNEPPQVTQPTHRIRFEGMDHGFKDKSAAGEALKAVLKGLLGHPITIEQNDDQTITWYSDKLAMPAEPGDCPESDIRHLLSQIKRPDAEEITRELKMHLTENFSYPKVVSLEWAGVCADNNQAPGGDTLSPVRARQLDSSSSTQTTTITTLTMSDINSEVDAEQVSVNTTPSPEPPVTQTEEPLIPPSLDQYMSKEDETNDETAPTTTETTVDPTEPESEDPFFASDLFSIFGTDGDNTTTTSRITTTTTPDTTTISSQTKEPVGVPASDGPLPTVEENMEKGSFLQTEMTLGFDVSKKDTFTVSSTLSDETPTAAPSTTNAPDAQLPEEAAQEGKYQAGKYVGLGLAFGIFVAFLLLSRSYTKGTYEVHRETHT